MTLSVQQVFGRGGSIYPEICKSIVAEGVGTYYKFMDISAFQVQPPGTINRVYWEEMLSRAHWAAISGLVRSSRWFAACSVQSVANPNYLGFCATLRGMTESAADITYSMGAVPETLALESSKVLAALKGSSKDLLVSTELEEALIHFQFARRLTKVESESAPSEHQAKSASKYISMINQEGYPVSELYSELCQIVHPAAQSLGWFTYIDEHGLSLNEPDDAGAILDICERHAKCIEWILQTNNLSILTLQVLNAFSLEQLRSKTVRGVDMSGLNLHNKIKGAFNQNNISWPE